MVSIYSKYMLVAVFFVLFLFALTMISSRFGHIRIYVIKHTGAEKCATFKAPYDNNAFIRIDGSTHENLCHQSKIS
jgi:hypothetical protein